MMDRRNVLQSLCFSIPLLSACSSTKDSPSSRVANSQQKTLKEGDTVGLISPGSSLSDEAIEKCIQNINALGFKVKEGKYWKRQYGYLAGTDKERVGDLHDMFRDEEVDAVWCARGGYGCTRLLPMIDYELIHRNPKPFIGYSDITALLNAFYIKSGLIGYHGPVASSTFTDFSTSSLMVGVGTKASNRSITSYVEHKIEVIVPGSGSGVLIGGNLSVLASMCGTPYKVDFTNKIVFLEDVSEKPYRVDRMLTQLLQSSNLDKANGIILGIWKGCEAREGDRSLTLMECFVDRLGDLDIPVTYGCSFGHIDDQFTLPVGGEVRFDTEEPGTIVRIV